jgi:hypothetical protein
MKRMFSIAMLVVLLTASIFVSVRTASAESITVTGPVTKIEMAADGNSAIATLKDNKTGELIVITVTDELTLDKFKDKRISEGDEIRCKFEKEGNKNNSKIFKKTAGC